jgi:hypothetical protein
MAWTFNPFSGTFDQKGSGGSASYIDGEVATYADLPLDGSAPLNSAWLVRTASGVWPVSRKQAGIYIRTATGGSNRDSDYTYAGTMPDVFSDSQFLLYENSDSSRNLAFDLGSITTGTTRTLTAPDANITIENTGHSSKHHTGGTDALAPSDIGAQSLFETINSSLGGVDTTLTAKRAAFYFVSNSGSSASVYLPMTHRAQEDVVVIKGATVSANIIVKYAAGSPYGDQTLATITASNQQYRFICRSASSSLGAWSVQAVDTHTHAASDVTSGIFDNNRINFAAPAAIGNTTPAAGTFTTLTANNGTLTASAPVLDLAQTWNNSGTNFDGAVFTITNTNSGANSNFFRLIRGSTGMILLGRDGRVTARDGFAFNPDNFSTRLVEDAAHIIAQRSTSNAQEFRVYNTFTSATSHERGFLRWSSNVFQIGTEKGSGGGTARALEFQTDGTTRMTISDIGAISLATGLSLTFASRVGLSPIALGSLRILGTDGSTFNFLYLGVNSALYPALKRSSAILQVRLGDDSAYTTIDALHRLQGTAPATSGATGTAGDIRYDADYLYVCTATNTWKRAAIATW